MSFAIVTSEEDENVLLKASAVLLVHQEGSYWKERPPGLLWTRSSSRTPRYSGLAWQVQATQAQFSVMAAGQLVHMENQLIFCCYL
jgi:hypothetical protein